jgi:hypothetical protein
MNVQVLTFDDLKGQAQLPANYGGFTWGGAIDVGWNETVGGFLQVITIENVDDPHYTGPVTLSSNTPFSLIGMSLACTPTAPDNSIRLEGWRAQSKIYDGIWIKTGHYFRYQPFFYVGVDAIRIYSPHDINFIDSVTVTKDVLSIPGSPGNLHVR